MTAQCDSDSATSVSVMVESMSVARSAVPADSGVRAPARGSLLTSDRIDLELELRDGGRADSRATSSRCAAAALEAASAACSAALGPAPASATAELMIFSSAFPEMEFRREVMAVRRCQSLSDRSVASTIRAHTPRRIRHSVDAGEGSVAATASAASAHRRVRCVEVGLAAMAARMAVPVAPPESQMRLQNSTGLGHVAAKTCAMTPTIGACPRRPASTAKRRSDRSDASCCRAAFSAANASNADTTKPARTTPVRTAAAVVTPFPAASSVPMARTSACTTPASTSRLRVGAFPARAMMARSHACSWGGGWGGGGL